jgi:recombination protein RecT
VNAQTIGAAVAVRDNSPTGMVQQYKDDFALVLPSHMKPEAFVRVAIGVLRRNPNLEQAARNDMGAFMAVMLDAARLGLEPGTEQYWLIPRKNKQGKLVVNGQRGYQGEIELIYRAGAVASVIVEVVYEGDEFVWNPGQLDTHVPPRWHGPQDRPLHVIDWDDEDREKRPLKRVYAYALMKGGSVSKVIVLGRTAMAKVKAEAQDVDGKYSPWRKWEESMWLKTGVHRLQKFVPTSSEYIAAKLGLESAPASTLTLTHIAPPMPAASDMWSDADDDGPVVAHWDHAEDDYDAQCPGCRAESVAADQRAAS